MKNYKYNTSYSTTMTGIIKYGGEHFRPQNYVYEIQYLFNKIKQK